MELEGKVPDVTNLRTKAALTSVENKVTDDSNLVKKTDYDAKVTEVENSLIIIIMINILLLQNLIL